MASRFASFIEEQILSINEAAVPKNTKNVRLKSLVLLRLTSFDHLPYRVT